MAFTLISIIVVFIGVITSIILFIIGVIRGFLKKGWRLVGYSILLFIATTIIYSVAQGIYYKFFRASTVQDLQNLSQPKNIDLSK
jgi:hypothetical protein